MPLAKEDMRIWIDVGEEMKDLLIKEKHKDEKIGRDVTWSDLAERVGSWRINCMIDALFPSGSEAADAYLDNEKFAYDYSVAVENFILKSNEYACEI